ncbi:MAG: hypothetical protein ACFFAN_06370 [Promethearchaeota archaeon]
MIRTDKEIVLNLLREKEKYVRVNDYISQIKMKKCIDCIIKKLNRKINKEVHKHFI